MEEILTKIKELTNHDHVKIVPRGNAAIKAAVAVVQGKILIPEEGGWLSYQKIKNHQEVKCNNAKIDLPDLEEKFKTGKFGALLYQNPGGYFAGQPMKEIYRRCRDNDCLVILDVSGSIGTELCDGRYADVIVCSFGKWKLVDAGKGGFISCRDKERFDMINVNESINEKENILKKLNELPARIEFLLKEKEQAVNDLQDFEIVHRQDSGFVVVVKFKNEKEKEKVINYCRNKKLNWTECPRYIRINKKAIAIEIKRLQKDEAKKLNTKLDLKLSMKFQTKL